MLGLNKRRRLEGIFVEKVGADQLALRLAELQMGQERVLHLAGARLESVQQVSMAAFEIVENVEQKTFRRRGIQRDDPVDDVVRPRLVDRVEISRLDRRPEGPHDHPRRIRAQIESLSREEHGFGQIVHRTLSGFD